MRNLPLAIVMALACAAPASAQQILPTDNGQRELDVRGQVETPIKHRKYYRGERELFGYDPRFTPNVVTFDHDNRPYIRNGAVVQTLNKDRRWIGLGMGDSIREDYPDWNGHIRRGPFMEERIVFDDEGDAYTIADLSRSNTQVRLLMHSRDNGRTWDAYPLSIGDRAVLEHVNGHNPINGPPVIAQARGGAFKILTPEKNEDGTLTLSDPVTIAEGECWTTPYHSGGSNVTITRDGRTHVVWIDVTAPSGHDTKADCYIATYHHDTGEVEGPVLLGHTERDNHNGPVATIDSEGYVHVLIGSHHIRFQYTRTNEPNSIAAGMTEPKPIGRPKRQIGEGGYTYTALVCDDSDTLHLSTRWAGLDYAFHIAYLRKKPGESWQHEKSLLIPFKNNYSVWYHKFNLDRQGRLFMNYFYYGTGLSLEAARTYKQKWPEEEDFVIPDNAEELVNGLRPDVTYHDPAIMMTDDGGDTWRLALTEDFAQAIERPLQSSDGLDGETTNSIGMNLRLIPAGDFVMGDDDGDFDEQPAHEVRISEPFYIGTHEVTVGQFKQFKEATGYQTLLERTNEDMWHSWLGGVGPRDNEATWQWPMFEQTDEHPITCIMRSDAEAFCEWLSEKEGVTYRLPTEAQWEYACRAGTKTAYSFGTDESQVGRYGWYMDNSDGSTHPVGEKLPNPWGLYDMHGNVAEWTSDAYGLYPNARLIDPSGPAPMPEEPKMVIRGGSWADDQYGTAEAYSLRSSARYYIYFPQIKLNWVGFRVVREVR